MAQTNMDRVIVQNLADLDAAAQHVYAKLQPAVAAALDSHVTSFLRWSGWTGEAAWSSHGSIHVAPEAWIAPNHASQNEHQCRFELGTNRLPVGASNAFWLTQLIGEAEPHFGLRWTLGGGRRVPQWKAMLAQQQDVLASLRDRGFIHEDRVGSFFLPFRVDRDALAGALAEDAPDVALTPFADALQSCLDARTDFDALLQVVQPLNEATTAPGAALAVQSAIA